MRITFFFWGLLLSTASVFAQPNPPEFDCVIGDTLTWTLPSDACGPLSSIDIFASPTFDGNYVLLDNVPATEDSYILTVGQSIANEFYYLIGNYDSCNPSSSNTSDTLTAEFLEVPPIASVDYTATGTLIDWEPSTDLRVTAYLIYKQTDAGPIVLDTVSNTEYFESGTQVDGQGSVYFLGVINECQSSSFDATAYASTVLNTERDACEGVLRIGREIPTAWPRTLVSTQIIRSRLGGNTDTVFVDNADSLITIPDIDSDTAYTIKVIYTDETGGFTAAIPVDLATEPFLDEDLIEIAQISYQPVGWQLRWRWNPLARYNQVQYTVRLNGNIEVQEDVDASLFTIPTPALTMNLPVDFDWSNATVTVTGTDACGVIRNSSEARPALIFPSELNPFTIGISWNDPSAATVTSQEWTLRYFGPSGSVALFSSDSIYSFNHDVTEVNTREVCYELLTQVRLPDTLERQAATFTWRTAPKCAFRSPRVFLPTGFIPEGYTISYRPKVSLIEGLAYNLKIYDRWGKKFFETDDPFEGWDGRVDEKFTPPGVYLAIVELEGEEGQSFVTKEFFTIIR